MVCYRIRGLTTILPPDELTKYGGIHPNFSDEIKYFDQETIYSIQIEVNRTCNQGCLYCYAMPEDAPLHELPKKDILTILDTAVKLNIKAIDWLGGDPLLRNDWYELMHYARTKGLINNIWTSGIPLNTTTIAKKVVEVTTNGFISVHLDTLNKELYHQLHRGNPATNIAAILKGVDNVQQYGKKPDNMINCITFTKPLVNDVETTIRYFYENKGMRTCLTQLCEEGLAKDTRHLKPSIAEIEHACKIRDAINYPHATASMATMDVTKYYCGTMICVTVDGEVTPCSVIRNGVGNIHHTPLEQIIAAHRNELMFLHLRDHAHLPDNCASCENNTICWGCRATAYATSGNLFGPDPNCYHKKTVK
jgi:radical SAM protein with 4Fe4S-binding SPASM domain